MQKSLLYCLFLLWYYLFMSKNKKKVLIVGTGAAAYAAAKKFASYDNIETVFLAPARKFKEPFFENADIREDAVQELLEFVLENGIDLTVAVSAKSIKAGIAKLFQENSQQIFAPTAECAQFTMSRSFAKKFLYKMHIPTPKFGIFEKTPLAVDYVKKAQMPLIVSSDELNDTSVYTACKTVNEAVNCIDFITLRGEDKIVIEDYTYGHNFTVYAITDGYQALPFAVCADYKFLEDGDGGLLTCGTGSFVPDYKISEEVLSKVMYNITNLLSNLERRGTPYLGILGAECVLTDTDRFVTTSFTPFLKDHDAQAVLDTIDENLFTLFEACTNGSFADDYEYINLNNRSAVSVVMFSREDCSIIHGLDEIDEECEISPFAVSKNEYAEFLTNKGRTFVLTQSAPTLTTARKRLYENVSLIDFKGKKYRTDICS